MSAVAATADAVETPTEKKQGWFSRFRQWTGSKIEKVKKRISESFVGKAARWVSNLGNTTNEETGEVTRNALGVAMDVGVGIVALPFKVVGGTCSLLAEGFVSPKKALTRVKYIATRTIKSIVRVFGVDWYVDKWGNKHWQIEGAVGFFYGSLIATCFAAPIIEAGYIGWGLVVMFAPFVVTVFMNWTSAKQMWADYTLEVHEAEIAAKRVVSAASNHKRKQKTIQTLNTVGNDVEVMAATFGMTLEQLEKAVANAQGALESLDEARDADGETEDGLVLVPDAVLGADD